MAALVADGKSLEEIEATAVETTALAQAVRAWVARQIAAGLQHRATKTQGKKKSRESVVLIQDSGKYWAGRVRYFLSHTPPGVDVSAESGVFIAHVSWYNHLPRGQSMSEALNCPVFKASFKDDKGGNSGLLRSLLLASLVLCITRVAEIVLSS